ncbi:hypothetical protein MMC30_004243 [Trapelia coarctata]|nr:hypothetical protein [Trapelia coarctata]
METTGLGSAELSMEVPAGRVLPYTTSKQEWDRHRATIEDLYREKNKTLTEVISIMERNHHFKATIKMYKNKITQWGLDKKNKENEIVAFIRKTTQRAAVGKKSVIRIRGRVLDPEEAERYLKRKRLSIEIVRAQSAPTPWTGMLHTQRGPEVFSIPEHIFTLIRDYITGSFESGTWISESCTSVKGSRDVEIALTNLVQCPGLACNFFDDSLPEDGARMLVTAVASSQNLLIAEPPELMNYLFRLIFLLQARKRPEIIPHILGQFSAVATVVLSTGHPIGQICGYLFSYGPYNTTNLVELAWQSAVDRFESVLGQTNLSVLHFRTNYVAANPKVGLEEAESGLRDLLHRCIAVHGADADESLALLSEITKNLLCQGKYAEAEKTARDSLAALSHTMARNGPYLYCDCLSTLVHAQNALGKNDQAEASFRQAINLSASIWGWGDSQTIDYLFSLEKFLVQEGKNDSAAEVRTQRREIIASLDVFV